MMSKFLNRLSILILTLIAVVFYSNTIDATAGFNVTVTGGQNNVTSTSASSGIVYANGTFPLSVSWSWEEVGVGYNSATVEVINNSDEDILNPKITTSSLPVTIPQSSITSLDAGEYVLKVTASKSGGDALVGALTRLIIDKTAPTLSTPSLVVKNAADGIITDTRSNTTTVKLELPTVTDDNFDGDFIIEVATGTTGLTYNTISSSFYTITSNVASINIGPTGLNLLDNTVNFRVSARDLASNVSTFATGKFIFDTTRPASPTNLLMKDGTETVAIGATRKGVTQLTWTSPAGVTDISHYNVYVRSGLNITNYVLIGSGSSPFNVDTTGYANGTIFFKVQSVDTAGNAIPEADLTPVNFILNRRDITFDIRYFASVTSGYLTVSGVSAINANQRETLLVVDNEPFIASYAIGITDINNDSYTFKSGNRAALETELRAITGSPDNGYYVVVRDLAANSFKIRLNLQQVGPTLPVNQTLTITSLDTKDTVGISSTVRIAFDNASGADYYKVFVDGEETSITNSGAGFVEVSLNTITFGNVENEYELRAYTNAGNFATYQRRIRITEDLVKPYAVVNYTTSRETEINFNLTLNDQNNRLTQVNAVLYLNNLEVQRQPVVPGTREYVFSGLLANRTNYQIRILGAFSYPSSNNLFPNTTIINQGTVYNLETLRTAPDLFVDIENYAVSFNNLSFRIQSTKRTTSTFDYEVKIYDSGTLVVTTPTSVVVENATTTLVQVDSKVLAGLIVGKNYQARIIDGNAVIGTINFFTTKQIPSAILDISKIEGRSLEVLVNVNDPDGAILTNPTKAILRVYNANGSMLIQSSNIEVANSAITVPVPNLDPDTNYLFKLFTSYRIDDQNNVNNIQLAQATFRTGKLAPTATVVWSDFFDISDDSILFDVNLEDPYTTLTESKVVLYRLDQQIGAPIAINRGRFSNLVFSGLSSNTEYVIVIQVKYDLNDGVGVITKDGFLQGFPTTFFRSNSFTTHKATPNVTVLSSGVTNTSATIRIQIDDPDTTFTAGSIKVFEPGVSAPVVTRVVALRAETFIFDSLKPNVTYEVVVEADYNINDGRGLRTRQRIFDTTLITDPNIGATIGVPVTEATVLRVPISVVDYLNQNVIVKLFEGSTQVGNNILLDNRTETIIFSDLKPSTIYRVAVEYTSGTVIQLAERSTQTLSQQALTAPTISLSRILTTKKTLEFSAVVVDPDNTITEVIDVTVCNQATEVCTIIERTIQELEDGVVIDVTEEGEYSVSLSVPYNILTTTGNAVSELRLVTISTQEPEPEPEPVQPIPTPREPMDLNFGLLGSVLGVVAIGFIGVFFYSFRRFYVR